MNTQSSFRHRPLIVILGPTAVGKTEISLQLAEVFNGEIISSDSRLFYRGMDIGTAKPTKNELARVKHHLIDVANPDQVWSLERFLEAAYEAIDDVQKRGKVPFMVGGSGQYIFAVVEGWKIPEAQPNPKLREILNRLADGSGSEILHNYLAELDPKAASKIQHQNIRRTIRALEVIFTTGERFSDQRTKGNSHYRPLIVGINRTRPALYDRIDKRVEKMLASGFIDEVANLLELGYSPDLPPLSAIGYRQVIQYLQGEISLDEAIQLMKRFTRQYVRRQANWFKEDDPRVHCFQAGPTMIQDIRFLIRKFLFSLKDVENN